MCALGQTRQTIGRRDSFHLRPVFALVSMTGMKQSLIQFSLIAQQKQPFGIGVQPANRINGFWKTKFRERTV